MSFLFMKANMASQTLSSLMEENRMMNSEMNRLEDLLSQARAERDDIGIKYQAVSDRVSTILTFIILSMGLPLMKGLCLLLKLVHI